MKVSGILFVVLVACVAVSCRQKDIRVHTIHVPDMTNNAAVQAVGTALARVTGVTASNILINPEQKTVMVTYDSLQAGHKNLEFAIAEVGFRANEVPAFPGGVKTATP